MLPFAIERLAGGFIESFAIGSMSITSILHSGPNLTCGFSFYGIAISQGYVYFRSCERDPLWIKCMAGSVLYVQSLHF